MTTILHGLQVLERPWVPRDKYIIWGGRHIVVADATALLPTAEEREMVRAERAARDLARIWAELLAALDGDE